MIRTQIQIEPAQERAIRRFARREGISLAEAVRRCIDKALASESETGAEERYRAALALVGSLRDPAGARDVASNHDAYLDEALG
ncbi:MAG TPA: CopG family transcriptional regulator [Polyangia bacterium]|nr:CopG family transcriptional regulator [Polyangia bacterium]